MRLFGDSYCPGFSTAVGVCHHQRHVRLIATHVCELRAIASEPDWTVNAIQNFRGRATEQRNAIERWYEFISFECGDVIDRLTVGREGCAKITTILRWNNSHQTARRYLTKPQAG